MSLVSLSCKWNVPRFLICLVRTISEYECGLDTSHHSIIQEAVSQIQQLTSCFLCHCSFMPFSPDQNRVGLNSNLKTWRKLLNLRGGTMIPLGHIEKWTLVHPVLSYKYPPRAYLVIHFTFIQYAVSLRVTMNMWQCQVRSNNVFWCDKLGNIILHEINLKMGTFASVCVFPQLTSDFFFIYFFSLM